MQKICLLVFSFLIFLSSFSISFATSNTAFAQEISPTPAPQVNYELPYPGLLPDSPLYILRVTRDRVVSFLISDPLKKAEFDLLQADKRLNAGIFLANKGKSSLALSTVSKAENYFEEALDKIGEARIQGRNVTEIEGKLKSALEKHKQELGNFVKKVNTNLKAGFEKELKRAAGFDKRLNH